MGIAETRARPSRLMAWVPPTARAPGTASWTHCAARRVGRRNPTTRNAATASLSDTSLQRLLVCSLGRAAIVAAKASGFEEVATHLRAKLPTGSDRCSRSSGCGRGQPAAGRRRGGGGGPKTRLQCLPRSGRAILGRAVALPRPPWLLLLRKATATLTWCPPRQPMPRCRHGRRGGRLASRRMLQQLPRPRANAVGHGHRHRHGSLVAPWEEATAAGGRVLRGTTAAAAATTTARATAAAAARAAAAALRMVGGRTRNGTRGATPGGLALPGTPSRLLRWLTTTPLVRQPLIRPWPHPVVWQA